MLKNIRRNAFALVAVTAVLILSATISIRAQAPEFSFRSVDGQTVTSESVRGEVVVLAFGASWLPLTRNQMEGLKKLADQYAGKGVAVYWVSSESDTMLNECTIYRCGIRDELREHSSKFVSWPTLL